MSQVFKIKTFKPNWVIILTLVSVTWVNLNNMQWRSGNVIKSDVSHYYSYLPALFYENDLSFSFMDDPGKSVNAGYYWPNKTPDQRRVIKMSMGMALTYLPFFGIAHLFAKILDYQTNGFSEPYHVAILFSSLFYFIIGLVFLTRVLRSFFTENITAIVLLGLCFGTNVFYYLSFGAGMSHATSFALIAAFLYYAIQWHRGPSLRSAILTGCLLGLLVLIRPINVLIFLFFILYGIRSKSDLPDKLTLFYSKRKQLFFLLFFSLLFVLPQLLYWKYATGNYFFNSYVGERFYFERPHIIDGLFGFRKGWLIYTPLMIFSLAGVYFLHKNLSSFFWPVLCLFCIYVYVTFSWWCWWYGGSFGQRALIDIYPILAIPLAAFFMKIQHGHKILKGAIFFIAGLFVLMNLFQTFQAKANIIHYDSMTGKSYFNGFFRISNDPDGEKYLEHPDYQKALRGEDEN